MKSPIKKKIIQLPRGYLSYSQKQLWKNDKARYASIYFDGVKNNHTNPAMDYGKLVADALEKQKETGDLLTDSAMILLPKYDVADEEFRATLKCKQGEFEVLAKPDTRDSRSHAFREYKTGVTRWTQKKAQSHPQMRYYAMAIYLKWKKLLREAHLDWIQTVSEDTIDADGIPSTNIIPTGHVESFRVTFTLTDILEEMADTARVAKEIEIAWMSHVKPVVQ